MGNHFHESAAKLHLSMTAAATAAIFFHRCLVETSSGDGGTAGRSDGKDWSSGSSSKSNGGSGSSSGSSSSSSSSSRPSSSSTPSSSKPSCVMPRCLEKYDAYVVAATCLFLASKVVEEPRRIRDVLNTTHHVRHPDRAPLLLDQEFSARREAIVACEQSVLRALAFDTEAETAYPALATLAETIGLGPTVLRLAHSLANDGLRCRRLIARTRPLLLAVGCVYVALSVAAGEGAEEKDEREEGDRLRAQQEQDQRQKDGPAPGVNQEWTGQTSGAAQGFVQANFVALPHKAAGDFLHFALRNPRACPVLAVTRPGEASLPAGLAAGADLRTDIPKYRVWRDGALVDEVTDISELWTDDMVGFLLGCSYSWEHALAEAGLCPRQIEEQCNVPMFRTGIRNTAVGPFAGDLVVSMRPYPAGSVPAVAGLTGRYPGAHGGPIHWGDPADLGLTWEALRDPHWGDAVSLKEDDVPMFWACGVTPQTAVEEAKLPLVITHAPGHMFICDLLNAELDVSP
eukprot:g5262.t1